MSETRVAARSPLGHVGRVAIHVVAPLLVGVVTYVAWRKTEVRLVTWLPRAVSLALRDTVGRLPMPGIVAGSLPDAAWGWSFGAAIALVWRGRTLREKLPWLAASGALAMGVELGQGAHVIPGTFDVVDLIAIVVGFAAGVLLVGVGASPRPASSPADTQP